MIWNESLVIFLIVFLQKNKIDDILSLRKIELYQKL